MKTETNLYLRSLVGEKKSSLCEAHSEELRKLNDALTALRTEEPQKQPTPTLSEKTVEAIRHLLEIYLKSSNEVSGQIMRIIRLIPSYEEQDKTILKAKAKIDEAAKALDEFNAAYPEKTQKGK